MKNKIIVLLVLSSLVLLMAFTFGAGDDCSPLSSGGAPAGNCGDPAGGNQTCYSCHDDGPSPTLLGTITSTIPGAGYTANTTYTITASIVKSGHTEYGFQVSPQSTSGAFRGTLANINSETQLVGSGKYVTHTSSGISGSGSRTWTFRWTAPSSGSGSVTFYGAFNATNSDNSSGGDLIYLSTLVAPECATPAQPSSISGTTSICAFSTNTYSVSPVSGATGYTWSLPSGWTGSSSTNTITATAGSMGGIVSVTANNICGSGTARTMSVTVSQISASASHQNVSCFGGNTGSASVVPSGGITPYSYSWTPSGGNASVATGLSAGSYTVTINDAIGCTKTMTFSISQPPVLTSTVSSTDINCFGANDGSASIIASGGTPSYSYLWNPSGGTLSSATGLQAGGYTVAVTDANGCVSTQTVSIASPTALTLSFSTNPAGCTLADGDAAASVSGGTPGYSYVWTNGQTTATATGLSVGSYSLTVSDSKGCTVSGVTNVINNTGVVASISSSSNVTCPGGSNGTATAVATGGATPLTYLWSSGQSTTSVSGLVSAGYNVTITDGNGCKSTATVAISQPPTITTTVTVVAVACYGDNSGGASITTLGGTAPYSYQWATGSTTTSISGLAQGTYSLLVTDANNCTHTDLAVVPQPSLLTATVSFTPVSCRLGNDGTATVSVAGGTVPYTYFWSTGETASTAPALPSGTYTINVQDANSCTVEQTVTVTEPALVFTNSTVITAPTCGNANGVVTAFPSGGDGPYTYSWNNGSSTSAVSGLTGLPTQTLIVNVNDANGCVLVDTVLVSCVTGVENENRAEEFMAYPNPVSDHIEIINRTSENRVLEWKSVLGEKIFLMSLAPGKTMLDMHDIPVGVYFLHFDSGKSVLVKKVVVSR